MLPMSPVGKVLRRRGRLAPEYDALSH
jgi:hypothetical protein